MGRMAVLLAAGMAWLGSSLPPLLNTPPRERVLHTNPKGQQPPGGILLMKGGICVRGEAQQHNASSLRMDCSFSIF